MSESPPEIPDQISAADLKSFLSGKDRMPISTEIPVLNFGGEGPCDFQLAVAQLMQRSSSGINILQLLVTTIHLLAQGRSELGSRLDDVRQAVPPFDQIGSKRRRYLVQVLQRDLGDCENAHAILARLMSGYMEASHTLRTIELVQNNPEQNYSLADFRSLLLFSDQILGDLRIERSAITDFLQHCLH